MRKPIVQFVLVVLAAAGAASSQTVWSKYAGNPVLGPGSPGTWDRNGAGIVSVLNDRAGYEFVEDKEFSLNQSGVGSSKDITGNADMGTRVRVVSGTAADGGVEHLTLMKIRQEWWDEDRKEIEARNASVMSAIFQDERIMGAEGVSPEDRGLSYVKTALFNRPVRKK